MLAKDKVQLLEPANASDNCLGPLHKEDRMPTGSIGEIVAVNQVGQFVLVYWPDTKLYSRFTPEKAEEALMFLSR